MTGPNIGVHLSLGRDPGVSVAQARLWGAGCIQIFASSPGAWKPPVLRPAWVEALTRARQEESIDPVFIHAIAERTLRGLAGIAEQTGGST